MDPRNSPRQPHRARVISSAPLKIWSDSKPPSRRSRRIPGQGRKSFQKFDQNHPLQEFVFLQEYRYCGTADNVLRKRTLLLTSHQTIQYKNVFVHKVQTKLILCFGVQVGFVATLACSGEWASAPIVGGCECGFSGLRCYLSSCNIFLRKYFFNRIFSAFKSRLGLSKTCFTSL